MQNASHILDTYMLPLHWAVRKWPDSRSKAFWVLLSRNDDRHVGSIHTLSPYPFPSSSKPFQTVQKFKGLVSSYHPSTPLSGRYTCDTVYFHWKFKAENESEKERVKLCNFIFSCKPKTLIFQPWLSLESPGGLFKVYWSLGHPPRNFYIQ